MEQDLKDLLWEIENIKRKYETAWSELQATLDTLDVLRDTLYECQSKLDILNGDVDGLVELLEELTDSVNEQ